MPVAVFKSFILYCDASGKHIGQQPERREAENASFQIVVSVDLVQKLTDCPCPVIDSLSPQHLAPQAVLPV